MKPLAPDPFEKLQSLVNRPVLASLANNSLLLLFETLDGGEVSERLVLRVNHPWRLFLENEVVGDSREFFAGGDARGRGPMIDWDRWCKGFANWVPVRLSGLSVGVGSPDLRLIFQSGHVLEAMSEPAQPADWSLCHHQGAVVITSKSLARIAWGDLMPPGCSEA